MPFPSLVSEDNLVKWAFCTRSRIFLGASHFTIIIDFHLKLCFIRLGRSSALLPHCAFSLVGFRFFCTEEPPHLLPPLMTTNPWFGPTMAHDGQVMPLDIKELGDTGPYLGAVHYQQAGRLPQSPTVFGVHRLRFTWDKLSITLFHHTPQHKVQGVISCHSTLWRLYFF